MKIVRKSSEEEMILEFLKGEINSERFNEKLNVILKKLNVDSSIIESGNIVSNTENLLRLKIMCYVWKRKEYYEKYKFVYTKIRRLLV